MSVPRTSHNKRKRSNRTSRRRRYALVGVGARSELYRTALLTEFAEVVELVGFCDTNPGRLELAQAHAQQIAGATIPAYAAEAFAEMVRETRPVTIIVTSRDSTHDDYIVRA